MLWNFENQVAVVTGAGSGIGAAVADAFLVAGATVVRIDIDRAGLDERRRDLGQEYGERCRDVVADITDGDAVRAGLTPQLDDLGAVHHAVHCAASFVASGLAATEEDWARSLSVNVTASALLTAQLSERMTHGATVVNISSISAHVAQRDRWTYNATKSAILALSRGQALDLAPRGIRVNTVSPGWIWTAEVSKAAGGDRARWEPIWGKYHMLERLGEAAEVANAVLFLSSEASSFITGTELMVDGGYSAMGPEGLGDTAHFAGSS